MNEAHAAADAAALPSPPPPAGEVDIRATGAREIVLPAGEEVALDDEDIETLRPPSRAVEKNGADDLVTTRPGTPSGLQQAKDEDLTPLYVPLQSRALRPAPVPSDVRDAVAEWGNASDLELDLELDSEPDLLPEDEAVAVLDPLPDAKAEPQSSGLAVSAPNSAAPSAVEEAAPLPPTVRPGSPVPAPPAMAVSPLAPPDARGQTSAQTSLWARAGLLLMLVVACVLFGVWLGSRNASEPAPRPSPAVAVAAEGARTPPAAAELPPGAAAEPAHQAGGGETQGAVQAEREAAGAASGEATSDATGEGDTTGATPTNTPARAAPRRKKSSGLTPAQLAALPETPSRQDVSAAMSAIQPQVTACAPDYKGSAQVDLTVANTGRVVHVLVGGYFAGKPEGSCIARVVRGASFPRFKQERFTVRYPITL